MINFTIKTLDSVDHKFSVDDETTVAQLKEQIRDKMGIEIPMQRLIFCGQVLLDDKKLATYKMNDKVVHLVPRPPPSPRSRNVSRSRQEMREALEEAQRVTNIMANSPTNRQWPFRAAGMSAAAREPAPDSSELQQTSTQVANRINMVYYACTDIRNSIRTLTYIDRNYFEVSESNAGISLRDPPTQLSVQGPPVIGSGPRDLAMCIDELESLRLVFEPFRERFLEILMDTNNAQMSREEANQRQNFAELCCDVMHSFAHAWHSISDIQVNIDDHFTRLTPGFSSPAPSENRQPPMRTQINLINQAALMTDPEVVSSAGYRISGPLRRPNNIDNLGANLGAPVAASTPESRQDSSNQESSPESRNDSSNQESSPEPMLYQVEGRVPLRIPLDTAFLDDFVHNNVNVLAGQNPTQGQGRPQAQEQIEDQTQIQGQGQNTAQAGENQDQANRPRLLMDMENMDQVHPGMNVIISMQEVHPMDSPLSFNNQDLSARYHFANNGSTLDSNSSMDSDENVRGRFVPFSFNSMPNNSTSHNATGSSTAHANTGANNAAAANATANNAAGANAATNIGANAANTGSDNTGVNFGGVRFGAPGLGGSPRVGMAGFPNAFGVGPDGAITFPPGVGVTAFGPTTLTLQPDVGGFLTPANANETSAMIQNVFNTLFRAQLTPTTSVNTSTMTTANSAAPNANPASAAPPGGSANAAPNIAGAPFTLHSHVHVNINADGVMGNPTLSGSPWVPGQEVQEAVYTSNTTPAENQSGGTRPNEWRRLDGGRLGGASNPRSQRATQSSMPYDRYLPCDSIHARQRNATRRISQRNHHRIPLPTPTSIHRLEQRNPHFTTRHMACMMRLLSGPISPEGCLNAFMVIMARVLFLESRGVPRSGSPMGMPREFLFVRVQMREYMQRVIQSATRSGGVRNPFDRIASVIITHNQCYLDRLSQLCPISEPDPSSILREFLRVRIPPIIACMNDGSSEMFVSRFYETFYWFFVDLCRVGISLCTNGFEGFRLLYTAFIDDASLNFEVTAQEWVRLLARENLFAVREITENPPAETQETPDTSGYTRPEMHLAPLYLPLPTLGETPQGSTYRSWMNMSEPDTNAQGVSSQARSAGPSVNEESPLAAHSGQATRSSQPYGQSSQRSLVQKAADRLQGRVNYLNMRQAPIDEQQERTRTGEPSAVDMEVIDDFLQRWSNESYAPPRTANNRAATNHNDDQPRAIPPATEIAGESAAQVIASADTDMESPDSSEQAAQNEASDETGAVSKPVASSGAVSKLVDSSEDDSKPMASSGAVSKPVPSSEADSKPVAISEDDSKPVPNSEDDSKPVPSSEDDSKPVASSGEVSKPVASSGEVSKPVASSGEVSKPVASSGGVSKPVANLRRSHSFAGEALEQATAGLAQSDNNIGLSVVSSASQVSLTASEPSSPQAMRLHWDEHLLPVLTRDQRLQRENDRPQEPLSDAYLYGMPARKRRCVRAARPPTTFDGFVNESVREATEGTAARLDTSQMRNLLLESVRTMVRTRAENSEDYDPVRYSATARFIQQAAKPTSQEPDAKEAESME